MSAATAVQPILAHDDAGSGPPIVLLHGAGLNRSLWEPQVEALSRRHRVVNADLRGHGATVSDDLGAVYDAGRHAEDVAALLDHLGIASAHIVGLSLGGMVGYVLALDHPGRVRSLLTMGSPGDSWRRPWGHWALQVHAAWLLRLVRGNPQRYADLTARRLSKVPEVQAYMRRTAPLIDPVAFSAVWRGVVAYRQGERLASLHVPTLVMVGARDFNMRRCRRVHAAIPGARLQVVPGAGHILNRDAPEPVTEAIEQWVAEHEPAAPAPVP